MLLLFGGYVRQYNAPAFIPFSLSIQVDGVNIGSCRS